MSMSHLSIGDIAAGVQDGRVVYNQDLPGLQQLIEMECRLLSQACKCPVHNIEVAVKKGRPICLSTHGAHILTQLNCEDAMVTEKATGR